MARPGTRIGAWWDDPGCPVDAEVLTILETAVQLLEEDGAMVDADARPVGFDESVSLFHTLVSSAISPGLPDDVLELARQVQAIPQQEHENPLLEMGRGTVLRHRDWILLDERRELLRRQWEAWFSQHDARFARSVRCAQPLSYADLLTRTMTVNGSIRPANDRSVGQD